MYAGKRHWKSWYQYVEASSFQNEWMKRGLLPDEELLVNVEVMISYTAVAMGVSGEGLRRRLQV